MKNYNPFSLKGKAILVTGASSGIGKATAIECSRMGAKLFITGRDEIRLKETFDSLSGESNNHKMIVADLTNEDNIKELAEQISDVDGIVLSAGKSVLNPILFTKIDKFEDIFKINFYSQVETIKILIKKKRLNKSSSVVFISSIAGHSNTTPGHSIYGTSKAALTAFMKYCVAEFSSKQIRFNTINPGMVSTPIINKDNLTKDDIEKDIQRYPLKRYGKPEEIAHGAIYLLSDASAWVTGTSLYIDGGVSV